MSEVIMFNIGDYILYGKNGVCRLTDICSSPFDENDTRTYYKLQTQHGASSVIFTPTDTKIASRKLMTKEEAESFIKKIPQIETLKVETEKLRREVYRTAVSDLSPESFVAVLKTIKERRRAFEIAKRHITEADAEYESLAKKSLYSELSIVLDIPYVDVEAYIAANAESI